MPGEEFPEIEPKRWGPRVAFAGGRLGHLGAAGMAVWSLPDGKLVVRAALAEPRAIVTLADGGLLAIAGDGRQVCRVAAGAAAAECWPSLIPLPSLGVARGFGDAKQADLFWVAGARALLAFRTKLVAGSLAGEARHDVEAQDPGGQPIMTALAGGGFVALLSSGFEVIAADGTRHKRLWAKGAADLAAGPAAGQVWTIVGDESVALLALDDPPELLLTAARDAKDAAVFTLASSATHVAALTVEKPAPKDGKPGWNLAVWDAAGKSVRRLALPWQPPVSETDLSIALSAKPALLAAASSARVVVWDLASGQVVLDQTN